MDKFQQQNKNNEAQRLIKGHDTVFKATKRKGTGRVTHFEHLAWALRLFQNRTRAARNNQHGT